MISVDWLSNWVERNKLKLSEQGIEFSLFIRNTETDNPAQVYDIDTKQFLARIALWESGDCNFEALEIIEEGGVSIFESQVIESEDNLNTFLVPLVSRL